MEAVEVTARFDRMAKLPRCALSGRAGITWWRAPAGAGRRRMGCIAGDGGRRAGLRAAVRPPRRALVHQAARTVCQPAGMIRSVA
jgi:hypothetical protein